MFFHERIAELFHKKLRLLLALVGYDVFVDEFRSNACTITMNIYLTFYIFCCFYTIATRGLIVRLNTIVFLCMAFEVKIAFKITNLFPHLTMLCNFQLVIKIYGCYFNGMEWYGMTRKIIDIYKQNSHAIHRKRQKLCQRFIFYSECILKIGGCTYAIAALTFLAYPIYMYLAENQLIPITTVYLPGIDETTGWGYVVLILFDLVQVYGAFFGTAGSDFLFTMLIANVPIMAHIFSDSINELNDIIQEKNYNRLMMKMKLRHILLQHKEFIE